MQSQFSTTSKKSLKSQLFVDDIEIQSQFRLLKLANRKTQRHSKVFYKT